MKRITSSPCRNGVAERNGHSRCRKPATVPAPLPPVSDGGATTEPPAAAAGRTTTGQFARGNPSGRGNPFARRLGALRTAFLDAVGPEDVAAVARRLRAAAVAGDVA